MSMYVYIYTSIYMCNIYIYVLVIHTYTVAALTNTMAQTRRMQRFWPALGLGAPAKEQLD